MKNTTSSAAAAARPTAGRSISPRGANPNASTPPNTARTRPTTMIDALVPSAGISTNPASTVPATHPAVLAAYTSPTPRLAWSALSTNSRTVSGNVYPKIVVTGRISTTASGSHAGPSTLLVIIGT